MHKHTVQNVTVGAFVSVALAVLALTVFVIGQERSMFKRKTRLWTSFSDINGLVVGAPVRLAGVDVGRVQSIDFASELNQLDARISLVIEDRYMGRVRSDSRAYIDSKGLLGDKIINVSVGTPKGSALNEGDYLTPKRGLSFESLAQEVESTARAIGDAANRTGGAVSEIASPEVTDNLRRSSEALALVLEAVAHGDGIAHHLLYDPSYAQRTATILTNLADASANAKTASARADSILARVAAGPGGLNSLVYGSDASEAVRELRHAAAGFAELTDQLNHGHGLAEALLRDDSGRELITNLTQFSERLNRVSSEVEAGHGTLGGLIVDPTVYEDMKTVLGNIERNVIFKALIRMTIKEDGMKRPAKLAEPGAGF
jgi:phospholipid/cholesterol/gamma-HCH transport system substrate-binding protein